jgi:hypothetical protein
MESDIVVRLLRCGCCDSFEAADEIERLREELTASHESHGNEVGSLTERLSLAIHERDEARREVCELYADTYGSVVLVAERRGWDCYKENADDR